MKTRALLLGLLLLAVSCGENDESPLTEQLTVENFQFSLIPGGARIVTGDLYNTSAERLDNVQINISLYDADNRLISSMEVLVQDVGPGEQKGFREAVDSELNVQGAKVHRLLVL